MAHPCRRSPPVPMGPRPKLPSPEELARRSVARLGGGRRPSRPGAAARPTISHATEEAIAAAELKKVG
jgi:hypothetical protein